MVNCPLCDAEIDVEEEELDEGEEVICEECGRTLIVVGTDPLELESADDEEDDEDYDDYDEDEEDDDDEEENEEERDWK